MKLDFGTAGIRGIVGYSKDNLNNIHAARVFDGFAKYLIDNFSDARTSGIVIGRDNRIKGKDFANIAVKILTSYGIKVYFNNKMLATPFISFLVRTKKAVGGINVTASHNPKEYNGIKLYNQFGCQLLPNEVKKLKEYFGDYENYLDYSKFSNLNIKNENVLEISINDYDQYINEIKTINFNNNDLSNLKIIYSPLHGTGYEYIKKLFSSYKANVIYEPNEIIEDENFLYVSNPNPEYKTAFKNTIKLANKNNADLILITDPDSDRVGVAVKKDNDFVLLNGNETAILITNYLLENKKIESNKKYFLVYSFVSTSLPSKMCLEKNIKSYVTETGFKWIGNQIDMLRNKEEFFFGFEESYGSLIKENLAHDKDAIQALFALSIVASEAKKENLSLVDKLDYIYKKYGYMEAKSISIDLKSNSDLEVMQAKFKTINFAKTKFIDYNNGYENIEPTNMLTYLFSDNLTWVSLRPSGTEPKIKLYIHVIDKTKELAQNKFNEILLIVENKLGKL